MEWIRRHWWWLGLLLVGGLMAWGARWLGARERRHDGVIRAAAERYALDPALIKAVMWRESRFDPAAKGGRGEVGLMQLREEAAREWAQAERLAGFDHRQMFHPVRNTLAGAWYLRKQLTRYARTDNPVPYALAAYNAGPSNVSRWAQGAASTNSAEFIRAIGFPSTHDYVRNVMNRQHRYARDFGAH